MGASSPRGWAVAALLLGGCGDGAAPAAEVEPSVEIWFEEVAQDAGLDFTHVRSSERRYWFPEIMGSGVALFDYDDDGALDVFAVQSGDLADPGPWNDRLFRNEGAGRFRDATEAAGLVGHGYGMGCATGDGDGDGDVDLYVTNVGPNALHVNAGDGTLRGAPDSAGAGHPGWGTSAAFVDYDADGDLDLFVTNYLEWASERERQCESAYGRDYCSPVNYDRPAMDTLLRNAGSGRFEDVTRAAGLGAAFGNGLGVAVGDFDGDGWVDLYVANDLTPNQLWHNRSDGTFVDDALLSGCAVNLDGASEAGMGVVAADVEHDGDLDLLLTHLRNETNTLYRNQGGVFTDDTPTTGLGAASFPYTGFGLTLGDLDLDGYEDVYVANGRVSQQQPFPDPADPYAEEDQLFRGLGAGSFAEIRHAGLGRALLGTSRGAAIGDVDADGDLDLVVSHSGGALRLLRNVAPRRGTWIGFDVRDAAGAPALGARVEVRTAAGRRSLPVQSVEGYASASDPRVHVGLGAETEPIEVGVRWSDGSEEAFGLLEPGRWHALRPGAGSSAGAR